MKRTLFLIRGLPSSGKSTFAGGLFWLGEEPRIFEADTYFYIDGKYVFDPKLLPAAHEDCRQRVEHAAEFSSTHLVVSNTFTQRWEMEPYIELSRIFGLGLIVIDLFDGGCDDKTLFDRNKHDGPLETFARMRERYEHDWRAGNPIPPWEREPKE